MSVTIRTGDGTYIVRSWDDIYQICGAGTGENAGHDAYDRLMSYQEKARKEGVLEDFDWICDRMEMEEYLYTVTRVYARREATTFIPKEIELVK